MLKVFCQFYKSEPNWALKFNDQIHIAFFGRLSLSIRTEQADSLDAKLSGKVSAALPQ